MQRIKKLIIGAVIAFPVIGGALPASAAVNVYSPSATCTIGFDLVPKVEGNAYLLAQTNTTIYWSADVRLFYGGAWHTVQRMPVTSRAGGGYADAIFSPSNGYSWDGYNAYVLYWVWDNKGYGYRWYSYSTNSCVVP